MHFGTWKGEGINSPSPTSAPGTTARITSLDSFDSNEPEVQPQIMFDYDKLSDKLDEHSRSSSSLHSKGGQVQSLTSRLMRGGSQASDSSLESEHKGLPSKNLISRLNKINKSFSQDQPPGARCEAPSSGEDEPDSKVSDLTRKFGGARKACLDKIKQKISKPEPDKSLADLRGERGDCFPALVFMLTPFAVIVLAGGRLNYRELFIKWFLFQLSWTSSGEYTQESRNLSTDSASSHAFHRTTRYFCSTRSFCCCC